MNGRLLLGICFVALAVLVAGCTGLGDATTEEGLMQSAEYDWETDYDVEVDLAGDEYRAVLTLEDRSEIRISQQTRYGTEHPIGIRAVQFRYPNGTVVDAAEIGVSESRSAVYLQLPEENGQLAFTGPKRSKQFQMPTLVEGSWEVVVPEGHRVENMVLGTVRPRGYSTEIIDDRVHIRWDEQTSSSVRVEYYLQRDLYLFAALIVVAAVAGLIGIGYVYRQLVELREKRRELGLDVDVDDDDRDRPPPGMR